MSHSIRWSRLLSFLAASLGFIAAASAEEPPAVPRWQAIAECQMVVLPQKAALPLLPDLGDDTKIDAAFATLQQMIGRGEATLIANLVVRGESATKLVTESAEEFKYATEFEPPQLPPNIPAEKPLEFLKAWPVVGIMPTAWEKRNVGALLEVTAEVSADGRWVSAEVAMQHVRFLRFAKFDAGIRPSGDHLTVEQPQFSSLKNTFTLQARAGQRLLVGVHKVPTEENTMELFILRIRAQKTGAAQ